MKYLWKLLEVKLAGLIAIIFHYHMSCNQLLYPFFLVDPKAAKYIWNSYEYVWIFRNVLKYSGMNQLPQECVCQTSCPGGFMCTQIPNLRLPHTHTPASCIILPPSNLCAHLLHLKYIPQSICRPTPDNHDRSTMQLRFFLLFNLSE